MINLLVEANGLGLFILLMVLIAIGIPVILFIIGLVILRKNKKRGKTILIIATVYSIISFGICGGFGF
jgi:hypothetical protein